METKKIIENGLLICGFINIMAVLLVTRLFTNFSVLDYQPHQINKTTLVVIIIFGLIFLTISSKVQFIPKLLLVLFVEKFTFFYVWAMWIKNHYFLAQEMLEKDFLSGAFQIIYGVNDLFWALFFLWAYYVISKNPSRKYFVE